MIRPVSLVLAGALCGCASTGTVGGEVAPARHDPRLRASEPVAPSPIAVPLDAATLSGMHRVAVRAHAHGRPLECEGVALAELLRKAGAMPAGELPGPLLSRYVLVQARDGYRVLYALAELDPATGNRSVYLVDRCDGRPLDEKDGPLRMIAPGDARPARWVRQVDAVTVIAAP